MKSTQFSKTPVTRTISPHSKFKFLPEDADGIYQEFKPHPNHKKPVGRCLAKAKSTGKQCLSLSRTDYATCRLHGGGIRSGKRTSRGEAVRITAITKTGQETNIKRTKRSKNHKELYVLKQIAYATNLIPFTGSPKDKPVFSVAVIDLLLSLSLLENIDPANYENCEFNNKHST